MLVGADVALTYCYLLSPEEYRDADTWGVRLLELTERGFAPKATIADAATGLRAGQAQALAGVPCRGYVFHALHTATPLVTLLTPKVECRKVVCETTAFFFCPSPRSTDHSPPKP